MDNNITCDQETIIKMNLYQNVFRNTATKQYTWYDYDSMQFMLQYRCLIVSNIGFWNWNLMQFMLIDLEGFDRDKGENHVEVSCIFASDYAFC